MENPKSMHRHRDINPSVMVSQWSLRIPIPSLLSFTHLFFSPFTNNPREMSSEMFPQGSSELHKGSEKNNKVEGSLQGFVCRYFSFMSRHLNTAALWKAAELQHEALIPQPFLKSFWSLLFGAGNRSKEEKRVCIERNLAHGPQSCWDLQLRISAHWRRMTWWKALELCKAFCYTKEHTSSCSCVKSKRKPQSIQKAPH